MAAGSILPGACTLPLSSMSRSVHTTCKIRGGIEGRMGFDRKKFCEIPESRITSTNGQDTHWGSGVCFFP